MSCEHGNPIDCCDECIALNREWQSGFASGVKEFDCIGVIDSDGNIYPASPEAGTQIFVKRPKP